MKLLDIIKDDWERYGYFLADTAATTNGQQQQANAPAVVQQERGIIRVNCIDCLDRTNVVQSVLGRRHLEHLLRRLLVLGPLDTLPTALPQVLTALRAALDLPCMHHTRTTALLVCIRTHTSQYADARVGGYAHDGHVSHTAAAAVCNTGLKGWWVVHVASHVGMSFGPTAAACQPTSMLCSPADCTAV